MDCLARLIATQLVGAATEMPCAAPPTRVYPAGTGAAEFDAVGLAAGLPDAVADAECVTETAGVTVPGALPHAVTATVIPITTGTVERATFICTFAAFPGNAEAYRWRVQRAMGRLAAGRQPARRAAVRVGPFASLTTRVG
jgi:hypothetical protein